MSRAVIGLTGSIACGKSNISHGLKEMGVYVIDADQISHDLTGTDGQALPLIRAAFGNGVFDGAVLNRRALGALVFGDIEALKTLNGILHPLIYAQIDREIAANEGIVILDAPLLFECGLEKKCDEVWCVCVSPAEQVRRVMERDGLSEEEVQKRIAAQWSMERKASLSDAVIMTDGTKEESIAKAAALYRAALKRYGTEDGSNV